MRVEQREADIVVTMGSEEQRIQLDFLERMNAALDRAETLGASAGALVVTADGKFWSNGLDVGTIAAYSHEQQHEFMRHFRHLLGRLVTFPMPTVAALNGHAFAGGAILALAFDYRVMRADRGWFCLPEVDLNMRVDPGVLELVRSRLAPGTLRDAFLSGRRYAANDALAAGIIDASAGETELVARACALAAPLAAKPRASMAMIKSNIWGTLHRHLTED